MSFRNLRLFKRSQARDPDDVLKKLLLIDRLFSIMYDLFQEALPDEKSDLDFAYRLELCLAISRICLIASIFNLHSANAVDDIINLFKTKRFLRLIYLQIKKETELGAVEMSIPNKILSLALRILTRPHWQPIAFEESSDRQLTVIAKVLRLEAEFLLLKQFEHGRTGRLEVDATIREERIQKIAFSLRQNSSLWQQPDDFLNTLFTEAKMWEDILPALEEAAQPAQSARKVIGQ